MFVNKDEFLRNEEASRDTIDVKRIYVDMAGGDLAAGVFLSQLVFWHLPKNGKSKLRVHKDGEWWVAKRREDWWEECRINSSQVGRVTAILEGKDRGGRPETLEERGERIALHEKGGRPRKAFPRARLPLVETTVHKFNGDPTTHYRILWENFLPEYESFLVKNSERNELKTQKDKSSYPSSLTETTTQITSESSAANCAAPRAPENPVVIKAKENIARAIGEFYEKADRAGVADPKAEERDFVKEVVPKFMAILGRTRETSTDRAAAKALFDLKGMPRDKMNERLLAYVGSDEFKYASRKGEQPHAFWIVKRLEDEWANKWEDKPVRPPPKPAREENHYVSQEDYDRAIHAIGPGG